ncbi:MULTISPECIES: hypothetical protein [unclassified Acinetobacter]|uniref:hypothetical protein n=1 Tax=unclassified Acinetobacter TaxID=196816 RepID=UPI0029348C7A|nr:MULTISPECIES: hypothetical protein [unclassified Acinetobacter]WOE31378.1 hypothetical protein QSG84_13825 [Acinetobacter sp. SAAs470]WOE39574.1 hypothetical protein QSG86_07490 [Acinetobacter sp. SAAs474]
MRLSIFISLTIIISLVVFLFFYFYQLRKKSCLKHRLLSGNADHQRLQHYDQYLQHLGLAGRKNIQHLESQQHDLNHLILKQEIPSLALSFAQDALSALQQQLMLSPQQLERLLASTQQSQHTFELILTDLLHQSKDQIRDIPIHFKCSEQYLTFQNSYILSCYLRHKQIYAYHIRDIWANPEVSLEHVYTQYIEKHCQFMHLGWKNYYYPHEARYALSSAAKLLIEEQRMIAPQLLSYQQFYQCLIEQGQAIHSCWYLDGVVMEILFTADYSALIELSKADYLSFYQAHYLAKHCEIQDIADGDLYSDEFQIYKEKAADLRDLAEQAAVTQGYEIDQDYQDPYAV